MPAGGGADLRWVDAGPLWRLCSLWRLCRIAACPMRHSGPDDGMRSALAGLEAPVGLVDDIEPPTPTHQTIVAMALAQRLEGVSDLHGCVLPASALQLVSDLTRIQQRLGCLTKSVKECAP